MTDFDRGDVVKLPSGGPRMTVVEAPATEVKAKWYETSAGEFREEVFGAGVLEEDEG